MKKILTLLLCATTATSFAVIGGVPSVTGTPTCVYGNKFGISSYKMSTGKLTGSVVTINDMPFFADDQEMMSYDIPFSKCPPFDLEKSPLIGIKVVVDELKGQVLPIFNRAVSYDLNFTNDLNVYAGGIITHNAVQYLQYMSDNRTNFGQYKDSYSKSFIDLYVDGKVYALHDDGKSSVYKNVPTSYNEAHDILEKFLIGKKLDSGSTIDLKEARAISDFIIRYDSQNGFHKLHDMLTGMEVTALGTDGAYQASTVTIVISKNKANTITIGLSYLKRYTYFKNYKFQNGDKTPYVRATIPLTIDLSNYNPDILTNTLNVSVNEDQPYERFVVADSFSGGKLSKFIVQYLFSANINNRAFSLDYSTKKNNDKFSMKR